MTSNSAPDYLEPIEGWRAWIVDPRPEGPVLQSVVRLGDWRPGHPLVGACTGRRYAVPEHHPPVAHDTPSLHCGCGIHAHRLLEEAAYYTEGPSRRQLVTAIGTVALWGSVIECTDGWRASHAYPVRLDLPLRRSGPAALRELEETADGLERYGVPVGIVDCRDRGVAEALGREPDRPAPSQEPRSAAWTLSGLCRGRARR
jgi:hypothetical protein